MSEPDRPDLDALERSCAASVLQAKARVHDDVRDLPPNPWLDKIPVLIAECRRLATERDRARKQLAEAWALGARMYNGDGESFGEFQDFLERLDHA